MSGVLMAALVPPPLALAARISDIANTKHNLSASSANTFKAASETGICVFCHTPHGAASADGAPLWNRTIPASGTYATYRSGSMQAGTITDIANPSKLCLTCHDGTQALGAVNNAPGSGGAGTIGMATGIDKLTGTANLGTDLTNDHPISILYDNTLAASDGELFNPAVVPHIGDPTPGHDRNVLSMPLNNGKVECATCHDPHIRDSSGEDIKFLRLNRFQSTASPSAGSFNAGNDIICLACHDKSGWVGSSHASNAIATETYTDAAATARGFPTGGFPVYRAACLNCHDPHTVSGAQRLQRLQGTENTCYQCHGNAPVLIDASQVPNIQKDFLLAYRMPVTNTDQGLGASDPEHHNARDADLTESNAGAANTLSGPNGANSMRHAECTDCHNPHRVANNTQADLGGLNTSATHRHETGIAHTNEASGVLRGAWGVEPIYTAVQFGSLPFDYTVKKGLGADAVSKEYQVCLKCHSSYAYGMTPPTFGDTLGGSGGNNGITSGLTKYTDQAMEFQAPSTHRGEVTRSDTGSTLSTNNHRSWHPVIDITGRDAPNRKNIDISNSLLAPWNSGVGTQTMYCSDCHGSANPAQSGATPSSPDAGENWGPHGSSNPFILKGIWNKTSGRNGSNDLCFKCHKPATYTTGSGAGPTGFSNGGTNLHRFHYDQFNSTRFRCSFCHIAVPHGWKNKALLVNLSDVGAECDPVNITQGGLTGTVAQNASPFTCAPYYNSAGIWIQSFASSGSWQENNCSGSGNAMDQVCDNTP